ncbi:MAG: hypothetical protein RR426_04070 [Oscillospiraceae bacterium]
MKRLLLLPLLLLLLSGCGGGRAGEARAEERVKAFAEAINYAYETPGEIYAFLSQDCRDQLTETEFSKAFAKERSYPYLTPLFINYDSIDLAEDQLSGTAHFSQAARLPGMTYTFTFVYEDGDYYMEAFAPLLDGSYLDKFQDIPYSLDSYFDFKS